MRSEEAISLSQHLALLWRSMYACVIPSTASIEADLSLPCHYRRRKADLTLQKPVTFPIVASHTSHQARDHSICLPANYTTRWSVTHIKLYLDLIVGDVKPHIERDWSCVHIALASQVRDLRVFGRNSSTNV